MVMDFLEGSDLRETVKAQGPLPVGTAVDYTVQICVGIAEAHANGIVHRDLKPSNLFITRRPDGSDIVKILDFGISKWRAGEGEIEELTQTGVVLGSPKYMAPEQLFGSSEVDARADVWSIGAMFYEMLAGRPPYDVPTITRICAELSTDKPPPSIRERRPEVSAEVEAVVMRCFMRDPDGRPQDVGELAGALLEAIEAPFAGAIRQKIAATLDPSSPVLSSSSPGMMPSGAFAAMTTGSFAALSVTGSGAQRAQAPAVTAPITVEIETTPTAGGPRSSGCSSPWPSPPPRWGSRSSSRRVTTRRRRRRPPPPRLRWPRSPPPRPPRPPSRPGPPRARLRPGLPRRPRSPARRPPPRPCREPLPTSRLRASSSGRRRAPFPAGRAAGFAPRGRVPLRRRPRLPLPRRPTPLGDRQ